MWPAISRHSLPLCIPPWSAPNATASGQVPPYIPGTVWSDCRAYLLVSSQRVASSRTMSPSCFSAFASVSDAVAALWAASSMFVNSAARSRVSRSLSATRAMATASAAARAAAAAAPVPPPSGPRRRTAHSMGSSISAPEASTPPSFCVARRASWMPAASATNRCRTPSVPCVVVTPSPNSRTAVAAAASSSPARHSATTQSSEPPAPPSPQPSSLSPPPPRRSSVDCNPRASRWGRSRCTAAATRARPTSARRVRMSGRRSGAKTPSARGAAPASAWGTRNSDPARTALRTNWA